MHAKKRTAVVAPHSPQLPVVALALGVARAAVAVAKVVATPVVAVMVAMAVAASAAAVAEEVGRHDCSVGHRPASAGDELS